MDQFLTLSRREAMEVIPGNVRARPSGTGEPWLGRPAGWRCVPRVEPPLTSRVYTGGR